MYQFASIFRLFFGNLVSGRRHALSNIFKSMKIIMLMLFVDSDNQLLSKVVSLKLPFSTFGWFGVNQGHLLGQCQRTWPSGCWRFCQVDAPALIDLPLELCPQPLCGSCQQISQRSSIYFAWCPFRISSAYQTTKEQIYPSSNSARSSNIKVKDEIAMSYSTPCQGAAHCPISY